jgi:hypothetical protein
MTLQLKDQRVYLLETCALIYIIEYVFIYTDRLEETMFGSLSPPVLRGNNEYQSMRLCKTLTLKFNC